MEPLAYLMRPNTFDDIVGQTHLVGKNGVIRRLVKNKKLPSIILYGKPGIGKTTIASVICKELDIPSSTFNASSDNKASLVEHIKNASISDKYILIVDEIHRMKKDIQDYLLPFVEKGQVTIIGITTVNPYMSVNPAIRSRCIVYKLNDLSEEDLEKEFDKALLFKKNLINKEVKFTDDAKKYIIDMAAGEVRVLLNYIEAIIDGNLSDKDISISLDDAKAIIMRPAINIDKNEDTYFQTLSGLQKSIRGSDVDASLHYLALLLASEDLLSLVRRLQIMVFEDIGLANPQLAVRVKTACDVALDVGMPEARIPLGVVVVDMALSPKSNSAYLGIEAALKDIEDGKSGHLPPHLKNTYSFDGKVDSYKYPHDYPSSWVYQQYLPDEIIDAKYYHPKESSNYEKAIKERYEWIEKMKKEYESQKKKAK
ncbi:MAG: replication-associated recombination protein A [Bacilli bacterium]|nr:replication-associated recombination protein A [Bacilli bacterium]